MKTDNDKLYPELRFKGFDGAWEHRKFFDNIKNTIDFRGRTPKKMDMDWSKSGYLALSALNVKNGYIDPSADAHYGNQKLYDKWMTGKELYKGQVLFTTEAPMGNVAQVPDNNKYILSQRTIAFDVDSDKITNDFLAVLLRSPKSFIALSSLASGGTAKGVSQKSLAQFKVTLPQNLKEQQKIGHFFETLDKSIALHEQKFSKLQELKKGYLQKMFPENGSKFPQLRFKGFDDAWEECELADSATVNSGRDYKHLVKGNIPVYGTGGYMLSVNQSLSAIDDAIGIGRKGTIDKPYLLKAPFWTVDTLFYVIPKANIDLQFLLSIFLRINWKAFDESTGVPSLSKRTINKVNIIIPNYTEQKKIGDFFKLLDHTITLQQRKLELLKEQKRGYLQKMFC